MKLSSRICLGCNHLKVLLGMKDSFPRRLTQWLLRRGLSSLLHGSLHGVTWAASQYDTWLSFEWYNGQQGRSHDVFYDSALEIIHYHSYHILVVILVGFIHCRDGHTRLWTPKGRNLWGHLGGCYNKAFRYMHYNERISNWHPHLQKNHMDNSLGKTFSYINVIDAHDHSFVDS